MIIAACSEDIAVKCFSASSGELLHEFKEVTRCSYSIDISKSGDALCMSDVYGDLFVQNLVYSTVEWHSVVYFKAICILTVNLG